MKVKIWDGMVRLFHWGTALLLPLCWYTADQGMMEWHMTCAYLLMTLLLMRVLWGFVGTTTARFDHFLRRPGAVIHYLAHWRHHKRPYFGHNPAGGYMVLVMLLLLMGQVITGLFATDDILTEGPLYPYVSSQLASTLTSLHHLIFDLILASVALHLSAILFYRLNGVNLVEAMLTGYGFTAEGRRCNAKTPMRWLLPLTLTSSGVLFGLILPLW